MKKPIIGVTCPWSVETWGDSIEGGGYYYVGRPYVEAISKYGGVSLLIAPEYTDESLDSYLDSILSVVDGLLFSGGGDVKRQSTEGLPTLRNQQPKRYDFEATLMKKAYEKKLPILGICRGFQMILEVFDGSLSEDVIQNHKQNIPGGDPWHKVKINRDSMLYEIIGVDTWDVNSFHVQKADKLPKNFIISVKTDDDVIEGIESTNYPFLVGYQFHPEELSWKDETAGKIFKWFMKASKTE